jgi:hypothetical protein
MEQTKTKLFGEVQFIDINFREDHGDKPKKCTVRLPRDWEWGSQVYRYKYDRPLMSGALCLRDPASKTAADLWLFRQIRIDLDGPEFSASGVEEVIATINGATVKSELDDSTYRAEVSHSLGFETVHVLRLPNPEQVMRFRQKKVRQSRTSLEAFGDAYDHLKVLSEGYSVPVPLNHKATVIVDLMEKLEKR